MRLLIEGYEKKLKHLHDNYEYELMTAKRQLEFGIDQEKFITSKLIDIQKGLDRYTPEIGQINDSSGSKAKFQRTLLNYAAIVEKISNLKLKHSHVNSQIASYKKKSQIWKKKSQVNKRLLWPYLQPLANIRLNPKRN